MENIKATATIESPSRLAGIDRWCRERALGRLAGLEHGRLDIEDADGRYRLGSGDEPRAEIRIHSTAFWRLLASGGSVGAGEAYVAGLWDSPDLVAVIRVLAANRDALQRMEHGGARFYGWMLRALHRLNRNTLAGSRRNISAHYDLGNEFFEGWLDRRMQYSSALFVNSGDSLEQAQENKLVRIAERLQLGRDDHLLEIGTGWGGLAIFMAERTGCRVTTTTISAEQYRYAVEQVARAGLESRITVLRQDYRELQGEYDKLVSVEMIEAVGADFLETYLACVGRLLKPDGLAMIQAITIEDFRYEAARDSVDFIKRYIFPGSFIPSVSAITGAMARAGDLGLIELFDLGESYARTLELWRERFEHGWPACAALGFDDAFRRRWRYYLAYCEGGFRERAISDVQLLMARPAWRRSLNGRTKIVSDPPGAAA